MNSVAASIRIKPRSFLFHCLAVGLLMSIDIAGQFGRFFKKFGRAVMVFLLTAALFCMVGLSMRSLATLTKQSDRLLTSSLVSIDQMLLLRTIVGDLQARVFRIGQGTELIYSSAEIESIIQKIDDATKTLDSSSFFVNRTSTVNSVEQSLHELTAHLERFKSQPESQANALSLQACSDLADRARFAIRTAIEHESTLLRNNIEQAKKKAEKTLNQIVRGWQLLGGILLAITLLWLLARWMRTQFSVIHARASK